MQVFKHLLLIVVKRFFTLEIFVILRRILFRFQKTAYGILWLLVPDFFFLNKRT